MKQTDLYLKPEAYFSQGLSKQQREERTKAARQPWAGNAWRLHYEPLMFRENLWPGPDSCAAIKIWAFGLFAVPLRERVGVLNPAPMRPW